MKNDKTYLLRAIEIAANGIFHNGGPFGALVVRNNKVIAEAFNSVVKERYHLYDLQTRKERMFSGDGTNIKV